MIKLRRTLHNTQTAPFVHARHKTCSPNFFCIILTGSQPLRDIEKKIHEIRVESYLRQAMTWCDFRCQLEIFPNIIPISMVECFKSRIRIAKEVKCAVCGVCYVYYEPYKNGRPLIVTFHNASCIVSIKQWSVDPKKDSSAHTNRKWRRSVVEKGRVSSYSLNSCFGITEWTPFLCSHLWCHAQIGQREKFAHSETRSTF